MATTGFFETGVAQGWAMAEAEATPRPSWVVAVGGVVLVTGFLLVPWLALLMPSWRELVDVSSMGALGHAVTVVCGAFCVVLWALLMRRFMRNLRTRRRAVPRSRDISAG